MAIRGENVGTAYIRIIADGTGLDRSIRDEMDGLDWNDMGRKGSKQFQEGWKEETDNKANRRELLDSIAGPLVRGKWLTEEFFRSENWQNFRNTLDKEFGDAGHRAGDNLETRLYEGMNFDGLRKHLDNLTPTLVAAQKQLDSELAATELKSRQDLDRQLELHWKNLADARTAEEERSLKDRLDLDVQWDLHLKEGERNYQKHLDTLAAYDENARRIRTRGLLQEQALRMDMERTQRLGLMHTQALRMNADRTQRLGVMQERAIAMNRHRDIEKLKIDYKDIIALVARLHAGTEEQSHDFDALRGRLAHLSSEMDRFGLSTHKSKDEVRDSVRHLKDLESWLGRGITKTEKFGDVVGKMMGKGSRNNFVNFIGSLAGGFASIPNIALKGLKGISDYGSKLKDVFSADGIGGVVKTLVSDFGSLAIAGPIAIAAIAIVAGPLASLLSMLAGIVVALAGSISFALVGAAGALAGAMGPLIGIVGSLVFAFKGLTDAQKKALSPISASFKQFQRISADAMFNRMKDSIGGLSDALKAFDPVVRKIATQVGKQFSLIAKAAKGKPFQEFVDSLERFMPDMTKRLGDAIRQGIGGMAGVFRGLMPITREFIGWLDKITGKFSTWANSAKGQHEIKDFFERAGKSAQQFGGFLKSVGGLLGTLLNQGKGAGDTMFGDMTKAVDGWNAALKKDPDILNRWFQDALSFGREVGKIAVAFGKLFDMLDSEGARTELSVAFKVLGGAMKVIIASMTPMAWAMDKLGKMFHHSGDGAKEARPAMQKFAGTLDTVTGAATRATRALALQKLQSTDAIDQSKQFGISQRDLIDASLGNEGAIKRVNHQLNQHKDLLSGLTAGGILERIGKIGEQFKHDQDKIRENNKALRTWKEALSGIKDKKLRIDVKNIGMDMTMKELTNLNKKYKLTPKEIKTIVRATDMDLTNKQLNALVKKLTGIDRSKTNPKVGVDDKTKPTVAAINRALAALGREKPKPQVLLDGSVAQGKMRQLGTDLGLLGKKVAKPSVQVDTSPAQAALEAIQRRVNALYGKTIVVRTQHMDVRLGKPTATGGIFEGMRGIGVPRTIGEAGPEAVVPLNRPLSQVDPAVRALSAIAQGKGVPRMASGGVVGGKSIDASGWQIVSNAEDPRAVAAEVVNRLAAVGY